MKSSTLSMGLAAVAILFLAAAFGASAMAWHYYGRATSAEARLKTIPGVPTTLTKVAPAHVETVRTENNDRVRELEAALAERDALIADMTREEPPAPPEEEPQRSSRRNNNGSRNFQRNREELARTDPERYAEIQAQREAFRQRMEQAAADRKSFFTNRDMTTLSTEMQETYTSVQSLLGQMDELVQLMQTPDLTQEERREIGGAMRDVQRQLEPLMQVAREDELRSLAADMGYDANGQDQFTEYVKKVFEITSGGGGMRGPGGGFGGGGPPPQ